MTSDGDAVLRAFHRRHPGASRQVFCGGRTADGRTPYEVLVDGLPPAPGAVLDLACGDGSLLAHLDAATTRTGVDMSPEELAVARERLGPGVRLVEARAEALPLADGGQDVVVSHMALMLMGRVEEALAEVARVLRPGGRFHFVVSGPAPDTPLQRAFREALGAALRAEDVRLAVGDPRTRTREGWDELLAGAFEPPEVETVLTRRELEPGALRDFLPLAFYPVELLSPAGREGLARALLDAVADTGGAPLVWEAGCWLFRTRRRA